MAVEVPTPGQGVQPQRESGGAFRIAAFPGLLVLPAEVLFDVAEAPRSPTGRRSETRPAHRVGGDEDVVGFNSLGVWTMTRRISSLVDPVTEHLADVDQPLRGPAAHIDGDFLPVPVPGLFGQPRQGGYPLPSRAGTAAFPVRGGAASNRTASRSIHG